VRFAAGINDERAAAAPVFAVRKRTDAMNVARWVGSRKRDPKKIIERAGRELRIVDNDN